MKLGIMQPYFMPYMGYFALIKQVDHFIIFDTPQFIRHGWIERNRMLQLNLQPFYIKVPLQKHAREVAINKVFINNTLPWKEKLEAQLVHYKKKAPYYTKVNTVLKNILSIETDSIVALNVRALHFICEYLQINTPLSVWSEMQLEIDPVQAPDEWALHICKALNADSYFNLPGGKSFFDKTKYEKEGIDLKFLDIVPKPYQQFNEAFIPFLSILDVMMFCDVKDIQSMLTFNLNE